MARKYLKKNAPPSQSSANRLKVDKRTLERRVARGKALLQNGELSHMRVFMNGQALTDEQEMIEVSSHGWQAIGTPMALSTIGQFAQDMQPNCKGSRGLVLNIMKRRSLCPKRIMSKVHWKLVDLVKLEQFIQRQQLYELLGLVSANLAVNIEVHFMLDCINKTTIVHKDVRNPKASDMYSRYTTTLFPSSLRSGQLATMGIMFGGTDKEVTRQVQLFNLLGIEIGLMRTPNAWNNAQRMPVYMKTLADCVRRMASQWSAVNNALRLPSTPLTDERLERTAFALMQITNEQIKIVNQRLLNKRKNTNKSKNKKETNPAETKVEPLPLLTAEEAMEICHKEPPIVLFLDNASIRWVRPVISVAIRSLLILNYMCLRTTDKHQPLDVGTNKPLKDAIRRAINNLLMHARLILMERCDQRGALRSEHATLKADIKSEKAEKRAAESQLRTAKAMCRRR